MQCSCKGGEKDCHQKKYMFENNKIIPFNMFKNIKKLIGHVNKAPRVQTIDFGEYH